MQDRKISGSGKTQIANEYTYRYAATYADILWVQADEPVESGEKVLARLAQLSTPLLSLKMAVENIPMNLITNIRQEVPGYSS